MLKCSNRLIYKTINYHNPLHFDCSLYREWDSKANSQWTVFVPCFLCKSWFQFRPIDAQCWENKTNVLHSMFLVMDLLIGLIPSSRLWTLFAGMCSSLNIYSRYRLRHWWCKAWQQFNNYFNLNNECLCIFSHFIYVYNIILFVLLFCLCCYFSVKNQTGLWTVISIPNNVSIPMSCEVFQV